MNAGFRPVPPELRLLRTFINSASPEDTPDLLEGPDFLEEWCARVGDCRGLGRDDTRRLRAFREALRRVLEGNSGSGDPALAWVAMEPFVRAAGYGMSIDATGSPTLEPAGHGAERTIAALLAIVYDAMRRGVWSRLKACRKESCRSAYYDRSKNASGAWCSMAVCGNRMKAKRRRNRAKNPA